MMGASEELKPQKRLNNQELIDEIKTFRSFGGSDTVSTTALMWALLVLASHQDWQGKIDAEVKRVYESGNMLDYDSLNRLGILIVGMIINETGGAQRESHAGKLFIAKGFLTIYLNVIEMQKEYEQWGYDPNEFNPGRFATQACAAFSLGEACNWMGQAFGMLEMKVVIAILQRVLFTPSPNYKHQPILRSMIPNSQFGMSTNFSPRSKS